MWLRTQTYARSPCHAPPRSPFFRRACAVLLQDETQHRLQWREFGLVYIAYMGFLVSRKNYGFWLRPVISELGYAKGQAGLIGSTLEVTYGTCSFLNGVVVRAHARLDLLPLPTLFLYFLAPFTLSLSLSPFFGRLTRGHQSTSLSAASYCPPSPTSASPVQRACR